MIAQDSPLGHHYALLAVSNQTLSALHLFQTLL